MRGFLLILTLLGSLSAFAQTPSQVLSPYSRLSDIPERLNAFSKSFLKLPYGEGGPLGEGPEGRYDQDPLYRFDTFDCTTFVETVVSLALAKDEDEFKDLMNEIRYERGVIDYLTRNHFPSLQWIPNNVENGLLEEINDLILPANQQLVAEAVVNLPGWLKKIKLEQIRVPSASLEERQNLLSELQAQSSRYSPVVARLNYLPITTLLAKPELLKRIPNGTIVNMVRPNWDLTDIIGTHMNVSHQGLIFQTPKGPLLRHASSGAEKKVMDNDFLEYLKKFENHPTLKGIHLMRVVR